MQSLFTNANIEKDISLSIKINHFIGYAFSLILLSKKRLLSNYVLGYTSLPIIVFNCVEQISKFPKRTLPKFRKLLAKCSQTRTLFLKNAEKSLPKFRKLNIKVHQKSSFVCFDTQLVCEIPTPKTR